METINVNGTIIKVGNVNGKVTVNIETENADVVINGRCVWSKFDQEEYVIIPENMRDFIKETEIEVGFQDNERNSVFADCHYPDLKSQASFYFKENQREPINVRFDYIDSLEDLRTEYLENILEPKVANEIYAEFKKLDDKIKETAEKYGFKWVYSHSRMHEMFGWWDIIVTAENWNEEGLVECWKLIEQVNQYLDLIIDEYRLF